MLDRKSVIFRRKDAMRKRIALLAIVSTLTGGFLVSLSPDSAARPQAAAKAPAQPDPDRLLDEALVQARQAFVRKDNARFELAAAVARNHPLAEYLDFWRLRMRLHEDSPEAGTGLVDREVREFLAAHPDTVAGDLMRRDWMFDLARRGEWSQFDRQYEDWALRDEDQLHCHHWLGQFERGEATDGARAILERVVDLDKGCGSLVEALYKAGRVDRRWLTRRLRTAIEHNSRDSVERIAALLGLDPVAVDAAWTRPRKILAAEPHPQLALIAISRAARPEPGWAAERLEQGIPGLRPADRHFAWSQVAAAGMRELAPESLDWTRRALKAEAGDITLAWMARAALREGDWPTLRQIIGKMSEDQRREPTWLYWHGRALLATGEASGGRALLARVAGEYHFYGQLAAEELGQPVRVPPRAAPPTADEIAAVSGRAGFARALRFYAAGLRLEGNREWNFTLRGMDDRELLATAAWACQHGVLDRCVNTAERTREEHDFSLRFITPFAEELKAAAAGRDLDPAWIYGLIRQESRFVMDARSTAGAQGLMQVMPATGRWIAGQLGIKGFHPSQLGELPTNLEFGTFYLRNVLDQLGGSPLLASAGYNAGPRRPLRWRTRLDAPVEGAVFAEIIPFSETRDYVKKVLSNAVIYAELFTGEPQSLKAWLGSVAPPPTTVASAR